MYQVNVYFSKMGKPKYKKLFPRKIYRCGCLSDVIAFCLSNKIDSLTDICVKVNETIEKKIYCVMCDKNGKNAVFSCIDHMPMVIFRVDTSQSDSTINFNDETKSCCLICLKKYLQKMFYLFDHVNFKKS